MPGWTTTTPKVTTPPKVSGWVGDWAAATTPSKPTTTTSDWQQYIGTMPSITKEQAAVSTPLSTYLEQAIKGIGKQPTFEEWAPGATPALGGKLSSQAKGVYAEAMRGATPKMFGGELGAEAQAAYEEALSGITPELFGGALGAEAQATYAEAMRGEFPEEYYQEAIYKPTMTEWTEDIMPAIRESYVATGAITGTEVGERLGKEGRRLGEYLAGTRAELAEKAKTRAFEAANLYQTAFQTVQEQAKQRQLIASGDYRQAYQSAVESAKARALTAAGSYQQMQLELTKLAYDDYTRQYPAVIETLQAALGYLNIPMMAAYQIPEEGSGGGGIWGTSKR